jgi:hypothetical protein
MPERTLPIARIRLARAPLRLLLPSLILLATAATAAGAGIVLGSLVGLGLVVAAAVLAVLSLLLAAIVLSVRLDVEVATLRLRWLGGQRRYALARGPVTRVLLRGDGAARLRLRFGALGWALGPAILRDSERIDLVRLAPTASIILVPTDQGRLGVAASSEAELIAALGAAARVQQRLDEATGHVPVPLPSPAAPAQPSAVAGPPLIPEGRLLTGIERTMLEERLAVERAAALAAAEAERQAALAAAEAAVPAAPPVAEPSIAAPAAARPLPSRAPRAISLPEWMRRAEVLSAIAMAALPVVGAAAVWLAAFVLGRQPVTEAELRPVLLALFLVAGGVLGVVVARTWFPRLAGLVSVSAIFSLVLIGRALLI